MIFVDPRNPKPLHEQLKESVIEQVTLGVLNPGDKLPSVREIAQSMRIAPNTIQRAYRDLETAGVISSSPGRGSFVTMQREGVRNRRISELTARFKALLGELKTLGVTDDEIIQLVKDIVGRKSEGGQMRSD